MRLFLVTWLMAIYSYAYSYFIHLSSSTSDFSEFSMEFTNRLMNHGSEYWYIGSMLPRSAMEKNSTEECCAIGLYPILVSSIFFSVTSATSYNVYNITITIGIVLGSFTCFSWISLAKTFEDDSTSIARSSSKILPSEDDKTSRILSSISLSFLQ